MSENRQALNKIICSLTNDKFGCIVRQYYTSNRKRGVSNLKICAIILTVRFHYTGNRKTSLASKFLCTGCTVTIEHALTRTPFTISHYPKKCEGFAIRNRESFTTLFKVTI